MTTKMADKTLQPLAQNFRIVDENGFPTLYFIKWAQQRQIDIQDSITLQVLQDYLDDHALREGSGIQFSPDGSINNSPIISADVQEILDQLTATRGAVIYRGLLGWAALLPGTSGQFLKTNGAGADPTWAAAGGGGGGLTPPVATDFPTRVNVGGETTISDLSSLLFAVDGPAASLTNRMMLKALPAAPRKYITRITMQGQGIANDGMGLVIRDSATGKFIKFGVNFSNPWAIVVQYWTSPTVFSSTPFSLNVVGCNPLWLQIADDGVNFTFQIGQVNGSFYTLFSASRTAFLAAPNQIGFGVEDESLGGYWLAVDYYTDVAVAADPGPYRYGRILNTATPGAFVAWTAAEFMATVGGANLATVAAQGFADSFFGGLPPSNAFDGNAATWWACNGTGVGSYIAYDFLGSPTPILQAALTSRNDGSWGQNATAISVQGSNDLVFWWPKFTAAGIVWTGPNQRILFS